MTASNTEANFPPTSTTILNTTVLVHIDLSNNKSEQMTTVTVSFAQ